MPVPGHHETSAQPVVAPASQQAADHSGGDEHPAGYVKAEGRKLGVDCERQDRADGDQREGRRDPHCCSLTVRGMLIPTSAAALVNSGVSSSRLSSLSPGSSSTGSSSSTVHRSVLLIGLTLNSISLEIRCFGRTAT